MLKKYIRKPVEVHARQYDGRNLDEIKAFAGTALIMRGGLPAIRSLECEQILNINEWVVRNAEGAFYTTSERKFHALNKRVSGDCYIKEPALKDAIRFDGNNFSEIAEIVSAVAQNQQTYDYDAGVQQFKVSRPGFPEPFVFRLGDYVVFGGGSAYPCNANAFEQTYELFGAELETVQRENKLNHVYAMDACGAGGAKHHYQILRGNTTLAEICFQNGARNAADSVDGVADEDLLEIVRDRLTDFQNGPFACQENGDALEHVTAALNALNDRTQDRAKRGVLGEDEA